MAPSGQQEPKNRQANSGSQSGYDGLERNAGELLDNSYRAASGNRSQKIRRTSQRSGVDPSLAVYIAIIVTAAVVIIDTALG